MLTQKDAHQYVVSERFANSIQISLKSEWFWVHSLIYSRLKWIIHNWNKTSQPQRSELVVKNRPPTWNVGSHICIQRHSKIELLRDHTNLRNAYGSTESETPMRRRHLHSDCKLARSISTVREARTIEQWYGLLQTRRRPVKSINKTTEHVSLRLSKPFKI